MKSPNIQLMLRQTVLLFFAISLLLGLSGCDGNNVTADIQISDGEINMTDVVILTSTKNENWQPILLEDNWMASHAGQSGYAWYKFVFELDRTPEQLWAIYIPHVNMNAEVWLNDKLLGSGGSMDGYIARNWNQPQYFVIPQGLLRAGDNSLSIRLVTLQHLGGALSKIQLGPESSLKQAYLWQYQWQVSSAFVSSVFIFISLVVFLALWFYCRNETFFLLAAFTSFVWFLNSWHFHVINISVDPNMLFRIEQILILWVVNSLSLTLSVYFYNRILKPIKYIALSSVFITLLIFFVPEQYVFALIMVVQLIAMTLGVSMDVLAIKYAYKTRHWVDYYLCFGLIVGMCFGIHDAMGLSGAFNNTYFHMVQFGAFFPISALAWVVVKKFAHALQVSENYNEELANEIKQKHRDLEESFNKLRKLEKDSVISSERERIMRDMHDGIGGQLVAVANLLQDQDGNESVDFEKIRKNVREKVQLSLTDLRFVIDSLDPTLHNLPTLLGMMRVRLVDQLESANIQLEWAVTDLPELPDMSPSRSLHIMRIVQEAITNSIKHSGSTKMKLETGIHNHNVYIDVIDYGSKKNIPSSNTSRGITNMKYRAAQLGADLKIKHSSDGTSVRLTLNDVP